MSELLKQLGTALVGKNYQILVVDDNSSDGTHSVVAEMAEGNTRIECIVRPFKMGLASAILDGFTASYGDLIVMMDADLSHRPDDLHTLVDASKDADIVIGSRYIKGSSIIGMSLYRRFASRVSIWISKILLGLVVKDPTSGFVVFRRELLEPLASRINPSGFKLLLQVLVMCPQAKIKEVPITFINRKMGQSKFGVREVLLFLRLCCSLRTYRNKTLH